MTEEQKIAALRTLLDGNTEDVEVLSVFLEEAGARILNRIQRLPHAETRRGV